jgi:hypothetical protein
MGLGWFCLVIYNFVLKENKHIKDRFNIWTCINFNVSTGISSTSNEISGLVYWRFVCLNSFIWFGLKLWGLRMVPSRDFYLNRKREHEKVRTPSEIRTRDHVCLSGWALYARSWSSGLFDVKPRSHSFTRFVQAPSFLSADKTAASCLPSRSKVWRKWLLFYPRDLFENV